jgi:hypothetical protein
MRPFKLGEISFMLIIDRWWQWPRRWRVWRQFSHDVFNVFKRVSELVAISD